MTEADLDFLNRLSLLADTGPFEARYAKDMPASACDFGVVSMSKGMEVSRIWDEGEARFYEALRNAAPELIRLARLGLLVSDK